MKPVLEITDYLTSRGGGIAESVRGLSRHLATPHLLFGGDGVLDFEPESLPWPEARVFPSRRLGPVAFSPPMSRALAAEPASAVHLHGLWGLASRALATSKLPQNLPTIVSPHGMLEPWARRRSRWKKHLAWQVWDGPLVRRAACLHALCLAEAENFRRLGLTQPIAIIPNGVSLPPLPGPRPDGPPRLLFLGRIHPKKGLAELIHGWAEWRRAHRTEAELIIAGWDDGGHLPRLEALVRRLSLQHEIHFPGPAFGSARDELLRHATAFILPSHSEGLPMTVLEAWAQGLPVILTRHCHLSEGVSAGAALQIEPDPSSIATALRELWQRDPAALRAMGLAGRQLVAARFHWPVVARQFDALYHWLDGGPEPALLHHPTSSA